MINRNETSGAYRHIKERRRKRKQRQKLIILSIVSFLLLFIISVTIIKVTNDSSVNNGKEKQAVDDSANVNVENDEVEKEKITIPYPTISDSYVEISSSTVSSPYIALLDVENHEIIAGRSCEMKIYPASMTKVMTLIVAVENVESMDDTFILTSEILDPLVKADASRAGFDVGEEVSAKNLLYGLILPSGADAAVALANMTCGSEEEFVKLMNKKCKDLGLSNTHFINTSGLHDENQYTTPIEMAMILEYAMLDETCAEILSTYQYTTEATVQHPEGILLTSTLFSRMYGDEVAGVQIASGKTGYTIEAKNCLVSYATKDNKHYVAVTAGASNRWNVIFDDFEIYKDYTPVIDLAALPGD